MDCITYTSGGDIRSFTFGDSGTFRKIMGAYSFVERCVVRMLLETPQDNIVTIYDLQPGYIDMELLDTNYNDKSTLVTDISKALDQLHGLNVVYIDLKMENVGYSKKDNCWKLFDFDVCGIVKEGSTSEWLIHPCEYSFFLRYKDQICGNDLYDLDRIAFREFIKVIDSLQ